RGCGRGPRDRAVAHAPRAFRAVRRRQRGDQAARSPRGPPRVPRRAAAGGGRCDLARGSERGSRDVAVLSDQTGARCRRPVGRAAGEGTTAEGMSAVAKETQPRGVNYELMEAMAQIAREKSVDKAILIETLDAGLLSPGRN